MSSYNALPAIKVVPLISPSRASSSPQLKKRRSARSKIARADIGELVSRRNKSAKRYPPPLDEEGKRIAEQALCEKFGMLSPETE